MVALRMKPRKRPLGLILALVGLVLVYNPPSATAQSNLAKAPSTAVLAADSPLRHADGQFGKRDGYSGFFELAAYVNDQVPSITMDTLDFADYTNYSNHFKSDAKSAG